MTFVATAWERADSDHDCDTLRRSRDPQEGRDPFEPGMTVWLNR
jgi:hypothetical protein